MQALHPALQQSQGRSKPWSGSTLINAFAEKGDGDKTDAYAIMAVPGFNLFSDIASQPVRGVHRMINTMYAVIGPTLYSIASDGTPTALGTIGGTKPVRIADNGTQLAIHGGATGKTGYILDAGTVYVQPTNLPPVSDVCYIDGYFVWTVADSDQFIISGLNDGLTYDPLDVATVEGDPDNLVGVVNSHRELLFLGTLTTEIWTNTGAADFPFERQGNAFIERGCIDKNSVVKIDNSVTFLGDDRIVYDLNGYNPVRISTHAIEYRLAQATYFRGFTYSQEGHKFYGLSTDVGSFFYDAATGAWAERQSYQKANYRVSCAVTVYGLTIFGDAYTGKLYVPSLDTYTENGDPIYLTIEIPTIDNGRELTTLYAIELHCETGVGTSDDPDPYVIMTYSKDGGRTYSNELWRALGKVGEYLTRAVWRPTVEFRQLQIRFRMPSITRRLVMSYNAHVE